MKDFDILKCAITAYRILWRERGYWLVLGLVPALIVLGNFLLLQFLAPDASYLRQGLLLLPATAAEGWLVTQFLRTLMTGERWPRPHLSGTDTAAARRGARRTRSLSASLILYVLTTLLLNGALALFMAYSGGFTPESGQNPPPMLGLLGLMLMAAGILGFRYLWLFVPAVIGFPLRFYDRALRGIVPGLQMIGVCLACYLPVIAFTFTLLGILQGLAVQGADTSFSPPSDPGGFGILILLSALEVFSRMMMSLASAVGLAVALRPLLAPGAPLLFADTEKEENNDRHK